MKHHIITWFLLFICFFPWETSCQNNKSKDLICNALEEGRCIENIEKIRIEQLNSQLVKNKIKENIGPSYDLKTIQSKLLSHRPHIAIISYFFTDSVIHLHFITKNSFFYHKIIPIQTLKQDIDNINKQINNNTTENYTEYAQSSKNLYECLIKPIASQANGYEWLVIPDKILCSLNFGALAVPPTPSNFPPETYNWKQLTYLTGEVTISYALSIIMALEGLNYPEPTGNYFVTSDSLVISKFFLQNQISKLDSGSSPTVFTHLKNEHELKNKLGNTQILWLEQVNDFSRFEIITTGFDLMIKNLIIPTGNPIEPTYNQLTLDFYCNFLEMRSAPYALRSAQQNFIGHPTYSAPKYWAKYRVWGI